MDKLTSEDLNAALPYLFDGEIDWFHKIADSLPDKAKVVILGAGPGLMALSLLERNPNLSILAIDHDPSVVATFNAHLNAAGFHVSPYIGDTCDRFPMQLFEEESVDLLVIDADHSYAAVKRDVTHWWPKVKYGGTVFFHDFVDIEHNDTNGVEWAIDHCKTPEWQEIERVGIAIVFKKVRA